MKNNSPLQGGRSQVLVGVVVVVMGCLFLLDNLGFADFNLRRHLVPALLIIFGALKLSQARTTGGYLVGGGLMFAGVVMTLSAFGLFHISGRALWPLAIIVAGLVVITRAANGPRPPRVRRRDRVTLDKKEPYGFDGNSAASAPARPAGFDAPPRQPGGLPGAAADDSDNVINITAVLASYTRRIIATDFRGGEITAIVGGCELDLRQSQLHGEAVIDVFAVCGGITIKVPLDWTVVLQGTPLLGGFEEKTVLPPDTSKRLIIRGYAVMGGLEVRN